MDIEDFVTLYIKSALIGKREADAAVAAFYVDRGDIGTVAQLDEFCDFLISTDRLTPWQCDKLRIGKWKGFYLDNYLLLEQIEKLEECTLYKSRDARNGALVCLIVSPDPSNGTLTYRVEPYAK